MANPLANVKLQSTLLNAGHALAQKLNISWEHLISLALKDFIRRHRASTQLVEKLNAAYADSLDDEEKILLHQMRPTHRHLVEGEW